MQLARNRAIFEILGCSLQAAQVPGSLSLTPVYYNGFGVSTVAVRHLCNTF